MRFEERILFYADKLNEVEDEIIRCIQENKNNLDTMSVKKMASETYVAPNTIIRLAKKLGYSGFSELKFSIKKDLEEQNQKYKYNEAVFKRMPEAFFETLQQIEEEALLVFLNKVKESDNIVLIGAGTCKFYCEQLGKILKGINQNVEWFQHQYEMSNRSSLLTNKDFVIFISTSGETEYICNIAKRIMKKKIPSIAFTSCLESTLTKYVNSLFYYSSKQLIIDGRDCTDHIGLILIFSYIRQLMN